MAALEAGGAFGAAALAGAGCAAGALEAVDGLGPKLGGAAGRGTMRGAEAGRTRGCTIGGAIRAGGVASIRLICGASACAKAPPPENTVPVATSEQMRLCCRRARITRLSLFPQQCCCRLPHRRNAMAAPARCAGRAGRRWDYNSRLRLHLKSRKIILDDLRIHKYGYKCFRCLVKSDPGCEFVPAIAILKHFLHENAGSVQSTAVKNYGRYASWPGPSHSVLHHSPAH